MPTNNRPPFAVYLPRQNGQPSYWRFAPDAPLSVSKHHSTELASAVRHATETKDPASLLMTYAEAIEGGHARLIGELAATARTLDPQALPMISPARLHASAIACQVDLDFVASVADLEEAADQLQLAATFDAIAFGVTSDLHGSAWQSASRADAERRVRELAAELVQLAGGNDVQVVPIMTACSFTGRTDLARALAKLTTFGSGTSPHEVTQAAWLRRHVGPAAGLREALGVIERDPGNTAARNVACACLVDLGRARDGLEHLAVALLQPDEYVGNTACRALRNSGFPRLVGLAQRVALERGPTPHARRLAIKILLGIGQRAFAELAMAPLAESTNPLFVFERRVKLDEIVLSGASR